MYSLSCCSCTPDNRGLITLITVLNSMVIQRKLIIVQVLIWISNCKISADIIHIPVHRSRKVCAGKGGFPRYVDCYKTDQLHISSVSNRSLHTSHTVN